MSFFSQGSGNGPWCHLKYEIPPIFQGLMLCLLLSSSFDHDYLSCQVKLQQAVFVVRSAWLFHCPARWRPYHLCQNIWQRKWKISCIVCWFCSVEIWWYCVALSHCIVVRVENHSAKTSFNHTAKVTSMVSIDHNCPLWPAAILRGGSLGFSTLLLQWLIVYQMQ